MKSDLFKLLTFLMSITLCSTQKVMVAQEVKYDQSLHLERPAPAPGTPHNCSAGVGGYNGEFQIYIVNITISDYRDLIGYDISKDFMAYKYEVVSFPFLANKDASAARSGRVLTLPGDAKRANTTFDLDVNNTISRPAWDFQAHPDPKFMSAAPYSYPVFQEYKQYTMDFWGPNNVNLIDWGPKGVATMTLQSAWFGKTSFPGTMAPASDRIFLPQTVLKLTLYFDKNASNIVSHTDPMYRRDKSISVILDLTRGKMADYPFNPSSRSSSFEEHDVTININAGEVVGNYNWNQNDERIIEHSSWDKLDTIKGLGYPASNGRENIFVVDYRMGNCNGSLPAGFEQQGETQIYVIDKAIDLTNINPSEKVIYNPGEVEITTDINAPILFPRCYTFRSVGGIYPEFDASQLGNQAYVDQLPYVVDHTAENGGPYDDLREIPIKSNAATHDANGDGVIDHFDVSVYRIMPEGVAELENGVTIYDATFVVEENGLLLGDLEKVFGRFKVMHLDGAGNIIGNEVINHGRREIAASMPTNGGLLELPGHVQLANNQTNFDVSDKYVAKAPYIEAADNDNTVLLKNNSDTRFAAFNYIDLFPGFDAEFGAEFTGEIVAENDGCVIIPSHEHENDDPEHGEGKRAFSGEGDAPIDTYFDIYPNPADDMLTVESSHTLSTIVVADATGKALREYKVEGSESTIDISGFPAGYYLVRMESVNEAFEWKPLVIE